MDWHLLVSIRGTCCWWCHCIRCCLMTTAMTKKTALSSNGILCGGAWAPNATATIRWSFNARFLERWNVLAGWAPAASRTLSSSFAINFRYITPYQANPQIADTGKIIATRYNDVFNNTNIVEDVLTKYKQAWSGRGFVSENGLFRKWYTVKQDRIDDSDELSHSAW